MVGGQASGNRSLASGSTSGVTANGTATIATTEQTADDRYAASVSPMSAAKDSAGATGAASQAGEPSPGGAAGNSRTVGDEDAEQQLDRMARQAAADDCENCDQPHSATKARGANWAIASAGPGMIPIRRTIQVVIREDALAVLDEHSATNAATVTGREFQFQDSPEVAYEKALTAIEAEIKDWGMAGDGLYWRPVVELKVGAGGERRTSDWLRLLKNGGFEVRNSSVARQDEGGASGANR
jgi:hypothetical protein